MARETSGTVKSRRKLVDWNVRDGGRGEPSSAGTDGRPPDSPGRPARRRRSEAGPGSDRQGRSTSQGQPETPSGGRTAKATTAKAAASPAAKGRAARPARGVWGPPAGAVVSGSSGPASVKPAAPASPSAPGGPAVDPRMRRRRDEVVRATGWRRLRIAGSIVVLVAVVGGMVGVAHTPLLAARDIRVSGAPAGSVPELLAAAGLSVGQPLIDVNGGRAATRLQQVPWVATARVRRAWPATVRVTIQARRPVAQIPTGASLSGPVTEVDSTGRIIARAPKPLSGLPKLLGVGAPGAVGQWLAQSTGAGWPVGSLATRPIAAGAALNDAIGAVSGALALAAGLTSNLALYSLDSTKDRLWRVEVAADATISAVIGPGPITVFFGAPTLLAAKATALVSMLRAETFAAGSLLDLQVPYRPTLTGSAVPSTP